MLPCLFHILSGQTSNKEKWYIAHTRLSDTGALLL